MNYTQFLYVADFLSECSFVRFSATGESFRSLEFQFRMSRRVISQAVIDVCNVIMTKIGPKYLFRPKDGNRMDADF